MQTIQYLYTEDKKIFAELKYTSNVFTDYTRHFHSHFGLALIEEGSLDISYDLQKQVTLDNHSIAIFNPNQIHRSHSIDAQGYYVLFLNKQWCQVIQKDFFFDETILNHPELYISFKEMFRKILQRNVRTIEEELNRHMEVLFSLYASVEVKKEKDLVVKIKEFIRTKCDESFNVDEIAKYVGYNKSYLIRRFKKEVGMTPQQYILNEKVNRAKDLLMHSSFTTLSDISVHAGFFDQSHFYRNFKGIFGSIPNRYKKVNIVQDNKNDISYD